MGNIELLKEGVNLMLIGVGFVVLFLLILIYAISLMSKIVNRFFPEPVSIISTPSATLQNLNLQGTDELEKLRPVIVAAIAHHRRQQALK